LDLSEFSRADGSLTVHAGGKDCDPYFAMKALLIADRLGLDTRATSQKFISWLAPRQRPDGGFDRFNFTGTDWVFGAKADADDSSLALWMQLLCSSGQLPTHTTSFRRAASLLEKLRIAGGTYSIALDTPVQLLMDNCEVYESLQACAAQFPPLRAQADSLARAIVRQFRVRGADPWRVSSQDVPLQSFYPQATAQLYPLLAGLESASNVRSVRLGTWYTKHGQRWLSGGADEFPWGLMAVAYFLGNTRAPVERWLTHAAPMRAEGRRWNILEEAIWQALLHNFPRKGVK
jgi:hypothetical protein